MKLVDRLLEYVEKEVENKVPVCVTEAVVYSACFGGVDELDFGEVKFFDGVTRLVFVDVEGAAPEGWIEIVIGKSLVAEYDPRLVAKVFKVLPHRVLNKKFSISLWIDANIQLKVPILKYMEESNIDTHELAVFDHDKRSNIYTEGLYCCLFGKDRFRVILSQLFRYFLFHLRASFSLFQGRIILRKHNHPNVIRSMDNWWAEIERGSLRDQLSFPVVLDQMKSEVFVVPHRKLPRFFKINEHLVYEFRAKSIIGPLLLKVVNKIYGR